jgi:uncharacterized membrane protein YqaE (UPF0057 family)
MSKVVLVILSIFLPPLAVYLASKSVGHTVLNIALCFLFWIPAVLHALYLSLKSPD